MFNYLHSISSDVLFLLLFIAVVSITFNHATGSNDLNEYIMTAAMIDGIKRSNTCGDGYRIDGALLKSYPYSKNETYLPYENCYMSFQARRLDYQIRVRIITLDLNDIHAGVNCLDSLRFYKSVYLKRQDRLNSVECGQVDEAQNFSIVAPTGIVTAHFSTDGGNVSGLGFKVVLTAFRSSNETHPCDRNDEEFLCHNGECISNLLLCDGIAHCWDASDEVPSSCHSNSDESESNNDIPSNIRALLSKHYRWRGISLLIFLLILLSIFTFFMTYFLYRRLVRPPISLLTHQQQEQQQQQQQHKKNYSTIVDSPRNSPKTEVILHHRKHLDNDYNLT